MDFLVGLVLVGKARRAGYSGSEFSSPDLSRQFLAVSQSSAQGRRRAIPNDFCRSHQTGNPELSTDGGAFYREVLGSMESDDFTVSISEATRQDVLRVCSY